MAEAVYDAWLKTVARDPRKKLLVDSANDKEWSARAIHEAVESLDRDLPGAGSWERRIVLLHLSNSVDWLTAFLLGQKRNAIVVPVDPDVAPGTLQSLRERFPVIATRTPSGFEHAPASEPQKGLKNRPFRFSACLIKLTSGATGSPRALFFTDGEMLADARQVARTMGLRGDDRNHAIIPFGHSYGLGNLVFPLIVDGVPSVLGRDIFPAGIAADFERRQPTFFPATPAILRALAESDVPSVSFRSLRRVISAGSFLPSETARAFKERFQRAPHNFYGSSETGGIAYDRTGEATLSGRSVGAPLEGVRVIAGPSGRLKAISPAVHTRYNRNRTDGLGVHTLADFGDILENGEIRLTGRKRTILKIGGRRLDPRELESYLLSHSDVAHAFVDLYSEADGNPRIALVYEGPASPESLRSRLRETFPSWKIPRTIIPHKFPVTRRGKIRLEDLRRLVQQSVPGAETPGG